MNAYITRRLMDILTKTWCASARRSAAHLLLLGGGLIGRLLTMYSGLSHYGFATSGCKHSKAEEPECVYPEGMNSVLVAFAEFDCFHLCLTMLTGAAWHQQERRLIHNCVPWVSVGNSLLHNIDHCRASSHSLPFLRRSSAPGPNDVYV